MDIWIDARFLNAQIFISFWTILHWFFWKNRFYPLAEIGPFNDFENWKNDISNDSLSRMKLVNFRIPTWPNSFEWYYNYSDFPLVGGQNFGPKFPDKRIFLKDSFFPEILFKLFEIKSFLPWFWVVITTDPKSRLRMTRNDQSCSKLSNFASFIKSTVWHCLQSSS